MYKIILLIDFAEEYSKGLLKGISKYSKEHGPWIFCRMPLFQRETIGIDGILEGIGVGGRRHHRSVCTTTKNLKNRGGGHSRHCTGF